MSKKNIGVPAPVAGDSELPAPGESLAPTPSVARNSSAKLLADAVVLGCSLAMGLVSARWLGPAGKGVLSALLFATAISAQAATLGLGDAAIILVGRRGVGVKSLARQSVPPLVASTVVTAVFFVLFWIIQFPVQWGRYGTAIAAAAFLVPLGTGFYFATALMNSEERFALTSSASSTVAVGTLTIFTVGSLLGHVSVVTGILAAVISTGAGLVLLWIRIAKSRQPAIGAASLRDAMRIGLPIESANVLVSLSQRLDQLLVFSLSGPVAAGQYSIAITMGQLIVYAPFAMSSAAFPRIAHLSDADVPGFIARLFRVSATSMLLVSPILLVAIAVGTPVVFGAAYRPSIGPAFILMVGGFLWISQWLLARALSARGNTLPLLQSFTASLLVMVLLNRLLVPQWGLAGAALASTTGAAIGLTIAVRATLNSFPIQLRLRDLLPGTADIREIMAFVIGLKGSRS